MALSLQNTTGISVEAPSRIPVQGGIFDAANVLTLPQHGNLGLHYETDGNTDARLVDVDEQTCVATAASLPDGFTFTDGHAFDVYAAVECWGFGATVEDFAAEAQARLVAGEQRAIESYLWNNLLPELGTELPGSPLKPKRAVGALETEMGLKYTYVPTLHFGRDLAADLADHFLVKFDGNKAAAVGGSRAVNGAGYVGQAGPGTPAVEAANSDRWLYATGQVTIWQGPIFVKSAFEQTTNKLFAVATRSEVVAIDGDIVYAARATLDQ